MVLTLLKLLKLISLFLLTQDIKAQARQPITVPNTTLREYIGYFAISGVPQNMWEIWLRVDTFGMHLNPPLLYLDSAFTESSAGSPANLLWVDPSTKLLRLSNIDSLSLNNTNPVGTIVMFAGATAPLNYLMCDGSAVSRTTYANLFAIIGTLYGAGDGSTTFNLPDMQQRFPLGKAVAGTGSTLGETGGSIDHLHTVDPPNTTTGAPSSVSGQLVGVINVASATHTHDIDISQFNSGTANPPYTSVNYIIKH